MPFLSGNSDFVKSQRDARHQDGTLVNPPVPEVACIGEARQRRAETGAQTDIPEALTPEFVTQAMLLGMQAMKRQAARQQAKKTKPAGDGGQPKTPADTAADPEGESFELRYSRECEQDKFLKIAGPTGDADGRIDTTPYVWQVDADASAFWRIQDPKAMESRAHRWMIQHCPKKTNSKYSKSAASTMTTHMIGLGPSHHLAKVNSKLNLVPLRGQYLSLTPDGDIRCLAPNPGYGMAYCIGAAFDRSKVRNGVYQPGPVNPNGLFGRYLATTFADDGVRQLAQEAFATILINKCFEKSIWMYGEGENGKSAMLHILAAVVGGRSVPISFERIVKNEFGTSSLHGARLATVAEAPKILSGPMQDLFKQIVSWDALPLERKKADAITFRPTCVVAVACNTLPQVGQHEHGFWRKVLTIPFTQKVSDANKVEGLHELIIASSAEMAQVIDWLLVGAQRLIKRGCKFSKVLPQAVVDLAHRQRMDADPVSAFIDESEATAEARVWTSKSSIYAAYSTYCHGVGRSPQNATGFWTGVQRLFPGVDQKDLNPGRKGPAIAGQVRDRYVPLRLDGVKPLDPMRLPAGWHETASPAPAPVLAPALAPTDRPASVEAFVDVPEWNQSALDEAICF